MVERYDRLGLVAGLRTNWSRLGPLRFLEDVASPLLIEVGRRWQTGELDIRHEHFASACLGDLLRELREPYDRAATGPIVAMATLSGDLHEGGLLMAAMVVALRGGRVLYLGTDMPVEQIAAAAEEGGSERIALGISSTVSRSKAASELERLRSLVHKRVPIWVGGVGAPLQPPRGVERLASLSQLDARMAQPGVADS
jgi:methanogenic corrinoid protein MtbC1